MSSAVGSVVDSRFDETVARARHEALTNPKVPTDLPSLVAVVFRRDPEGIATNYYHQGSAADRVRMINMSAEMAKEPSRFRVGIPGHHSDWRGAVSGKEAIRALQAALQELC